MGANDAGCRRGATCGTSAQSTATGRIVSGRSRSAPTRRPPVPPPARRSLRRRRRSRRAASGAVRGRSPAPARQAERQPGTGRVGQGEGHASTARSVAKSANARLATIPVTYGFARAARRRPCRARPRSGEHQQRDLGGQGEVAPEPAEEEPGREAEGDRPISEAIRIPSDQLLAAPADVDVEAADQIVQHALLERFDGLRWAGSIVSTPRPRATRPARRGKQRSGRRAAARRASASEKASSAGKCPRRPGGPRRDARAGSGAGTRRSPARSPGRGRGELRGGGGASPRRRVDGPRRGHSRWACRR